jgi:hypothetical protein
MNENLKEILNRPGLERLRDYVSVGAVQSAAVEYFVDILISECATVMRELFQEGDEAPAEEFIHGIETHFLTE